MRLAEWQLNDARDALERYRKYETSYGVETERQAMIDLIERVVEIANQRRQENGKAKEF